jgi:recombination protein RecR
VYEGALQDLIDELGRLPGVGPKSAQRIAFHLLATDQVDVKRLAAALVRVKDEVRFCATCFNVAEGEQCQICRNPRRSEEVLCVVEEPKDVVAVERTGEFRGRYHVLGGALSALDGVTPERLNVASLLKRARDGVDEVILAVNATVEGQTTAHYLMDALAPMGVKVTRLAHGVPVGGELDYLDEGTLSAAFKARRSL